MTTTKSPTPKKSRTPRSKSSAEARPGTLASPPWSEEEGKAAEAAARAGEDAVALAVRDMATVLGVARGAEDSVTAAGGEASAEGSEVRQGPSEE